MQLRVFSGNFHFPAEAPPGWSRSYERWTQLDAPAFLLAEAYSRWKEEIASRPDQIFLAAAGASNGSDLLFARAGAASPTKFVHTLPNVRASSLLAVMRWQGPVFSLHRDPFTLATAFGEACRWSSNGSASWIWHLDGEKVWLWIFGGSRQSGARYDVQPRAAPGKAPEPTDLAIRLWFCDSKGTFALDETWQVQRA